MKKTVLAALISATLLLTACDDKEKNALIEQTKQQTEQLAQLNNKVSELQQQLEQTQQKLAKAEQSVVIMSEPVPYLVKKETVKSKLRKDEDYELDYQFVGLKTNFEWLNELLFQEFAMAHSVDDKHKVETLPQLMELLEKGYQADKSEMVGEYGYNVEATQILNFVGQRGDLAAFTMYNSQYSGGAHGTYFTQLINVDLAQKKILHLSDLFDEKDMDKVKELLWSDYVMVQGGESEVFTDKGNFDVVDNFKFSPEGITFLYPIYSIASYAEGEQELLLSWNDLEKLLTPEFKQSNVYKGY